MLSKGLLTHQLKQQINYQKSAIVGTQVSKRTYKKVLDDLAENVCSMVYEVRGQIPARGEEIMNEIKIGQHSLYQFEKTTGLNIGNPQKVGQNPITFNRQVLAGMVYPQLVNSSLLNEDAKNRIKLYCQTLKSPVGAYTSNSKGWQYIRKTIANFIEHRDGVEADPNEIYLTNGASEGVRIAYKMLIRNQNDGIFIPIPQYPLYSALTTLSQGTLCPYYLDEDNNWSLNPEDLEKRIIEAKNDGINVRALVLINPGNPTGQVLSRECIEQIIRLCFEHGVLIMADEVYQQNIYDPNIRFVSVRKVLHEMGHPYRNTVELISMHSTSKGLLGECGLRGGYFEAHNLSDHAKDQLYKLKSIELCSNTVGQVATALMIDPPTRGVESDQTVDQYEIERNYIMNGLKERAQLLTDSFNKMNRVTCTKIQGAMYGFPRVHFTEKFLDHAKKEGLAPDYLYCLDMVNETGIMTVPGSGFGQLPDTYHFRITNLINPTEKMAEVLGNLERFNDAFHEKWE